MPLLSLNWPFDYEINNILIICAFIKTSFSKNPSFEETHWERMG